MKKTFFIAVAFVCFSNFAFANVGLLKTDTSSQALTNLPIELITNHNEKKEEVSKTKSGEDEFVFCYEISRYSTYNHGVEIITVISHCTVYNL